jgi:preprotein translocase SecE subunit
MITIAQTREFAAEVADELKKVTWPDWPQLKNVTLVVLVFIILVSLLIFGMDLIVRNVLGLILNLFTA